MSLPDRTCLLALAEECERAAGPNRGLDGRTLRREPPHPEIWLQPWCADCRDPDGRQWCEDDAWGRCEKCEQLPVRYVLAPALPPEPPPGFVRATVWVATGEDGSKFYAAENREEVETVAIDNGLMPYRVSRISGDFPLVGVAEITGVVTP